jgi:hypothetical protein
MSKKSDIEKFIRADLAAFGGYSARVSPETLNGRVEVTPENIIKLDANENPYGCSPKVKQALADAGKTAAQIDEVVLVGGQTRMPLVQRFVEQILGKPPERGLDPMECVAVVEDAALAAIMDDVREIVPWRGHRPAPEARDSALE